MTTEGVRVRKGKNLRLSEVEADQKIVGGLPGIELPGRVLSTYPLGPGPFDVWATEKVRHQVVDFVVVRGSGVVGPAYGVTVGLEQ